ncbi:MAG: hypothetical protein K8I82_03120 [Anaerolineae bacterium]|nr:hypothetical protein [Anaerolineae bacterium]
MDNIQQQIQVLQAAIAQDEATITALNAEVQDLQAELVAFKQRYDSAMKPIFNRVEIAKEAIAELEEKRKQAVLRNAGWNPPDGYESIEEQYRRKWQKPREEAARTASDPHQVPPIMPDLPPEPVSPDLKKMYHQLARRYHPDHAINEQDRKFRTKLMAQINAAYADKDLGSLKALADHPEKVNVEEPLAVLQLRQLQQKSRMLRQQIFDLKQQRHNLLHCDLMKLKVEETLLQRQGRDLLKELATEWESEYKTLLQKLYDLRREVS